jgi:hypothetical protein
VAGRWYDAADRMGMLIVAGTALWDMAPSYALDRDVFWTNARDHVVGVVRRLRHHPSIVMWDAEDQLLASGGASVKGAEQKVAELIDLIHQTDATRPVMCSGDADPGGRADVISLSRPHELPCWTSGRRPCSVHSRSSWTAIRLSCKDEEAALAREFCAPPRCPFATLASATPSPMPRQRLTAGRHCGAGRSSPPGRRLSAISGRTSTYLRRRRRILTVVPVGRVRSGPEPECSRVGGNVSCR